MDTVVIDILVVGDENCLVTSTCNSTHTIEPFIFPSPPFRFFYFCLRQTHEAIQSCVLEVSYSVVRSATAASDCIVWEEVV